MEGEEIMELRIDALRGGDNCTFYRQQRDYEATMVKNIDRVIFAIILTVAASLIGLIISLAVSEYGLSAATAIGTLVSGTAMKFIFNQKAEHRSQEDQWVKAINDDGCPP
jgi:hypothetical protein